MRARRAVMVVLMMSVAVAAMALEPYTDKETLTVWVRAKCGLSEREGTFTWADREFTADYGRNPPLKCTCRILYRHSTSKSIVEHEILWELWRCNMYYLVKVDFDRRRIDECSCMTLQPDSDAPSGDFGYTTYTF